MKIFQGTIRCCCEHAKNNNNNNNHHQPSLPTLQQPQQQSLVDVEKSSTNLNTLCLYSSKEFCNVLLECINLNNKFCNINVVHPNSDVPVVSNVMNDTVTKNIAILNVANCNSKKKVTPSVSINVTDAENLNVCMCSLYASHDNVIIEQESIIGTICSRCQNIIKQQPTEHRKTLISKRLQLSKDIIVNRVDTHFLSLRQAFDNCKQYEPYTPESIESHSPLPDPDVLEYEQNDDIRRSGISDEIEGNDIKRSAHSIEHLKIKPLRAVSGRSSAVSPQQLKSRLEILRKTSTDASGMVISNQIADSRKNRIKRGFCFNRCCCIF